MPLAKETSTELKCICIMEEKSLPLAHLLLLTVLIAGLAPNLSDKLCELQKKKRKEVGKDL